MMNNENIIENKQYRAIPKAKIICFDVETTGVSDLDEILQLSVINGAGEILFNEYLKPNYIDEWEQAEAIHGITPEMVADKLTIDKYIPLLQEIFSSAELIVGYNNLSFDNDFLERANIIIPTTTMQYDVMLEFAPIYGEWNDYFGDYKWQKLSTCADYYGYQSSGEFHDSTEDVRATLHCFYCMMEKT